MYEQRPVAIEPGPPFPMIAVNPTVSAALFQTQVENACGLLLHDLRLENVLGNSSTDWKNPPPSKSLSRLTQLFESRTLYGEILPLVLREDEFEIYLVGGLIIFINDLNDNFTPAVFKSRDPRVVLEGIQRAHTVTDGMLRLLPASRLNFVPSTLRMWTFERQNLNLNRAEKLYSVRRGTVPEVWRQGLEGRPYRDSNAMMRFKDKDVICPAESDGDSEASHGNEDT